MITEEGRDKQCQRHYSFLKVLDEITAPSVNLDLFIPSSKPKHEDISAPLSNNLVNPAIHSYNSRVTIPPRKSSKRVKLLDSNDSTLLESTLRKSNSTKPHAHSQTCLSSLLNRLSSWDTASLDCFIDEAFSVSNQQKLDKNDAMVTKQNKYSSRHLVQNCSHPVSPTGPSVTRNPTITSRDEIRDSVRNTLSSARRPMERYEQRDDVNANEHATHHHHNSPNHRFRLMQTIKDLNKRSGKKRKMASEQTSTEEHESLAPVVSSGENVQDIIQCFPLLSQTKAKTGATSHYYRQTQTQPLAEKLATPVLTPSSNTVNIVVPRRGFQYKNRCEVGNLYRGLPVSDTLARNRAHPQRVRSSTLAQGTKTNLMTSHANPSQTHLEPKTPEEKRPPRVKSATYKRASINMKSLNSPKTPRIGAISPQIPLMPPTAPPQYPLPQIPHQLKCCKVCPQSTFTAVKVIAEELPQNDEDLKRRRSTQSSSISVQNRIKRQQRRSMDPALSSSAHVRLPSDQPFSSDSESDRELEQPILSPLKLRSKRTKRNDQVHELKKRHSTKQIATPESRSKRVSFQTTRPLRPRLHNRKDSQTITEMLLKADYYEIGRPINQCCGSSSKNNDLRQNLSRSGVWVLIDSDPNSLHGFQAGAISQGVSFSNPWKTTVTKNHAKARAPELMSRNQKIVHKYHQTVESVAPHETFTIYGDDVKRRSDLPNQLCGVPPDKSHKSEPIQTQNPSHHRGTLYTVSLESYRRAASIASCTSKSQYPQQEHATETGEATVQIDFNDMRETACPPPSPASTNGVDASASRSSSPICRNMSVLSDTSRLRKGSDGSLTDPNEYDCLSYSPLMPQSYSTPKELLGPDLPATKATVHSTVTLTPLKQANKASVEHPKMLA